MIRIFISVIFLFQFFSGFSNLQETDEFSSNIADLQIKELIKKYDIPGAAIAIIHKDSSWISTYGLAYRDKDVPITDKTIFRIASISKSFLAIAINQLANEGKISLNDPVRAILPDLGMDNQWEENDPVRIIHLLEHTSSIDDVHFNEGYNPTAIQKLSLEEVFSINPGSRNVRWKPGEISSYSNDAFSVLALIVEKTTGQPFEVYIRNNVFKKIGAVSTSYNKTNENASFFAQGYTIDGLPFEFKPVLMRPSGGLNSTIQDLASFVQMLLNSGVYNNSTIIDSTTLNNMLFPSSSIPAKEGFKPGYGSGFSTFFVNGNRFFGHGGGLPDFNSVFLFSPELEGGIVVLINQNSDYFWRIVKKVVSALQMEKDRQQTKNHYTVKPFKPDDIEGYYTQVDYGISLDRFPNYFLSGQKISFQNDTLCIKEFQSEPQDLIHVDGNAYKKAGEINESIYFFKNSDGEMMLTLSGKSYYQKSAEWKPLFHRGFLMFSIVICISFIVYMLIWIIGRIISKFNKRVYLNSLSLARLLPLLSIISLIVCLFSLSLWFGDFNNAGNMTINSLIVFIFSLLFPLLSLLAFWSCSFRKNIKIKYRIEKVYLMVVTITLVGLSIFLYHYEIIGVRLWAY